MADEKKKEETKTKTSKAVEKLVDEVAKLSVLELSDLVNALQDKLGVSAMPVAAAAAPAVAGDDAGSEAPEAKAKQTVVITAVDNKIAAIKAIRAINQNLGLKEAKDLTESLPAEILKDAKAEEAKEATDKLKEAGATVELK